MSSLKKKRKDHFLTILRPSFFSQSRYLIQDRDRERDIYEPRDSRGY